MEMTGDKRLLSENEMDELSDLEVMYLKNIDESYGLDTTLKKEFDDFKKLDVERTRLKINIKIMLMMRC
jgi:hypothetical protein